MSNFRLPSLRFMDYVNNPVITHEMIDDKPDCVGVADPFIVKERGRYYCFFELCTGIVSTSELGCASSLDAVHWRYEGKLKGFETRAAFPNVFKFQDNWHMLPDIYGSIEFYNCVDFPLVWNRGGEILNGKYDDSDILNHNGVWWLFTCDRNMGGGNVSLYYNDSVDWRNSSWNRHNKHLVISGNKVRLGGKIINNNDGSFILPVQSSWSGQYGERLDFYVLNGLDKERYEISEGVEGISGFHGKHWTDLGVHHISMYQEDNGNLYAIDGLLEGMEKYSIGICTDGKKEVLATAFVDEVSDGGILALTREYDGDNLIQKHCIKIKTGGFYELVCHLDFDYLYFFINGKEHYLCNGESRGRKIINVKNGDFLSFKAIPRVLKERYGHIELRKL